MSSRGFDPGVISGVLRPPGSKSLTIRAMTAAALAPGRSHLYGALSSDDTEAMSGFLAALGVPVDSGSDPWVVTGTGGALQVPGTPLDARLSGLTARIGMAMAALVDGTVTVDGQGRLRERPMAPLLGALSAQGVGVVSTDGHLPVTISGMGGLWGDEMEVDSTVSSQFTTALLLVAPLARNPTVLRVLGSRTSEGYARLTCQVMRKFGATVEETVTGYQVDNHGYRATDIEIEPDVSAAVYPMVGAAITGGQVEIEGVSVDSEQPDMVVVKHLKAMGCRVGEGSRGIMVAGPVSLDPVDVTMNDAPDGAMALAVAALFASGPSRIDGLSTFRHKESDRMEAMKEGLESLGGTVRIDGDALIIEPGTARATKINSQGDHRVAMALALAGLRIGGVRVTDPEVVDKTWPGFWEEMATIVR